ncbi:MAG: GNAT family N-acetyltransferase, partial [Bacteroidota bacterium]
MEIKRVEEIKLSPKINESIIALLGVCFPNYPKGRSYYHQIPDYRLLAYEDKKLVGQMSVDHRMMNISGKHAKVLGISDFCVHPKMRKKHISSKMLLELEAFAKKYRIQFLVLSTSEPAFYKKHGFKSKNNICKWLAVL